MGDHTYYIKNSLPPLEETSVRILFEGLFWFAFHGDDECEVGIHNNTKSLFSSHHHEPGVRVWKGINNCGASQDCGRPEIIPIGDLKQFAGIQVDVNRPKDQGVYVYQEDDRVRPREDPKPDADWRWMIDFEQPPLYANGIKLKAKDINPGISINHGIFYTLLKSTYKFELRPGPIQLAYVTLMVGCDIALKPEGDVTLMIRRHYPADSTIITLPWADKKCYQIDFSNVCMKHGERCRPEDYGDDENDFHLYNRTYDVPSGKKNYRMYRLGLNMPDPQPTRPVCGLTMTKSSNEAPCGPVCAGGGGGGR